MSKSQKFKDNFLRRVKHMQFCLMRICFLVLEINLNIKREKKKMKATTTLLEKVKLKTK